MKISISSKLILLVTLLVTLTAAVITLYFYNSSTHILVQHALADLTNNIQREEDKIGHRISELQNHALFLSQTPPISGIIRAQYNSGYDDIGKSTRAQWQKRLATIFTTLLTTVSDFQQVRFIDKNGLELVKVERSTQGLIVRSPTKELQNKSNSNYVRSTLKLKRGEIYLSEISLNREFEQITKPYTPVIRAATPVFDHKGKLFGLLAINLDIGQQLQRIEQRYNAAEYAIYITKQDGSYLSHPDMAKRYSFDLGHRYRIQEDFIEVADLYSPNNTETSRHILPGDHAKNVMVMVKLFFDPRDMQRFIAIILAQPYEKIISDQTRVLQRNLWIILLLVLLAVMLAVGFSSILTDPLKKIVSGLDSLLTTKPIPLPSHRQDEIGSLARALENMAAEVNSSQQKLQALNAHLEDEVEQRTEELHKNLQLMNAISQAQTTFINNPDPGKAFDLMLSSLLALSGSEYGFIGEVLYGENHKPYLHIYVSTNIAWSDETRQFYDDNIETGMEFHDLDNLFGQVILTGETVLSNDPKNDPCATGLPHGHPPLHAFLGIPIKYANNLIGMVAIANRPLGYNEKLLQDIEPFITTCANLIIAYQSRLGAEKSEQALEQTRAELEHVVSNSPTVFYTSRAYGDFGATYISPNIKRQLGYEAHEFLADTEFWAANIHPDDKARVFSELSHLFEHGHHSHTYRFKNKQGRYIWMYDELQLQFDAEGKPKEIIGSWVDITERKEAEQALKDSEEKFRSIITSSPMGIFIYVLHDDGRLIFTDYNDAANTILRVDCSQFVGLSIEEAFPALADTDIPMHYRRTAAEGIAWENEDIVYDDKQRIHGAFEVHAFQTEQNVMAVMFLDVTERNRTQGELKRFKSTLEQTQDCVFMFEPEKLNYFYVNKGAMELVGYDLDELMHMHPYDLNKHHDEISFREFIQPLLNGSKSSMTFEAIIITKQGEETPVEIVLQYILPEGEQARFVSMVRDITERKKIEKMKNEFVSTVSHELRTPLTSIRGSLGLITGGAVGELPRQVQDMLRIASNNTERLLLLINDILDMQKIESGQLAFTFKPVDIMALLEQAVHEHASYAEEHKIRFVITQRQENIQVYADHDRLMQVLSNLMSNAAKFSPQGDTVELALTQHEHHIRLTVTDHGPGIPEAFQPKLFERFTQSDASDSRQKGGTGLGLSIVKAIVERHHGHIHYTTQEGEGTSMSIDLPLIQAGSNTAVHDKPVKGKETSTRLLILEDDADIALLLQRMLAEAGYQCDIAYSAAEARQLIQANGDRYKAMTLDIGLPDSDGISFITELRQNEKTRTLPIIVVSVEADEARRQLNGGAVNIVDWLNKPIDEQRLLQALQTSKHLHKKACLLHVEDDTDIHNIVKTLFQGKADLVHAKTVQEAKHAIAGKAFDLILLDIALPDGSGLVLLHEIEQHYPASKLVIYSNHDVAPEDAKQVHAVLAKATTDNQRLLGTIESLLDIA